MQAHLKKRALAEFSHSQSQVEPPPAPPRKKLKLKYRPKPVELQLNLYNCKSSSEAIQLLSVLEESLPIDSEHVEPLVSTLLDHFCREAEPSVRAKIVNLLGHFSRLPACNGVRLADDLKNFITSEKSHTVIAQLIGALQVIGQSHCGNTKLCKSLLEIAFKVGTYSVAVLQPHYYMATVNSKITASFKNLGDASHFVRCKCLELIGALGSHDQAVPTSVSQSGIGSPALNILLSFTCDSDCRVRSSAFQCILMWHRRGIQLEQAVYNHACQALKDDNECVRLAAVKLVWVLGQLYPEFVVKLPESNESIRLVDDCFANICNMVNDISMRVRAEAAKLLGSLHSVSPRFLEQTLDKKLMSNMRRKRSAHERQKEHFESGEWSTGQKWADDAPKEDVDPESVSLIMSGACGAFVHGLEDEFLEVRNAAIDSLCELASHSPGFAKLSQDFLVDMFNDEIESIRLNAINSLQKICRHFLLREDQLEIILGVLKDFSAEIRESMHGMVQSCRLGTIDGLRVLIFSLLDNLTRYPDDKQSIWKCMMYLGQHHTSLVLCMVPDLLSVHPYFETKEHELDDPAYVGILILVFNAAVDCPTIMPMFPAFLPRHYTYLRDILPDLVPCLPFGEFKSTSSKTSSRLISGQSGFLAHILQQLAGLKFMERQSALKLMKLGIRDLRKIDELAPEMSATAKCITMYLQCQLYLDKAFANNSGNCMMLRSQQQIQLEDVLLNKMETQFVGLGLTDLVQIRQLCLKANTLHILASLQSPDVTDKRAECLKYLAYITQLQDLVLQSGSTVDYFTDSLMSEMPMLQSPDPSNYYRILLSALKHREPSMLQLSNQLKMASATIISPAGSSDFVHMMMPGLIVAIRLVANISNVEHLERICIQVKYADQRSQLITPALSDFRQLGDLQHKLITRVLLSHGQWSESCPVQLCIVLACPKNRDDSPEHVIATKGSADSVVELCTPIKVNIFPNLQREKRS